MITDKFVKVDNIVNVKRHKIGQTYDIDGTETFYLGKDFSQQTVSRIL